MGYKSYDHSIELAKQINKSNFMKIFSSTWPCPARSMDIFIKLADIQNVLQCGYVYFLNYVTIVNHLCVTSMSSRGGGRQDIKTVTQI